MLDLPQEVVAALVGAFVGGVISLGTAYLVRLSDTQDRLRITRILAATKLRLWMNELASTFYDTQNYIASEGNAGTLHGSVPGFKWSLDKIANLGSKDALDFFGLLHQRDVINSEVDALRELVDDEAAVELLIGRLAMLWLDALSIHERLSLRTHRKSPISGHIESAMEKAADDFKNAERERQKQTDW